MQPFKMSVVGQNPIKINAIVSYFMVKYSLNDQVIDFAFVTSLDIVESENDKKGQCQSMAAFFLYQWVLTREALIHKPKVDVKRKQVSNNGFEHFFPCSLLTFNGIVGVHLARWPYIVLNYTQCARTIRYTHSMKKRNFLQSFWGHSVNLNYTCNLVKQTSTKMRSVTSFTSDDVHTHKITLRWITVQYLEVHIRSIHFDDLAKWHKNTYSILHFLQTIYFSRVLHSNCVRVEC